MINETVNEEDQPLPRGKRLADLERNRNNKAPNGNYITLRGREIKKPQKYMHLNITKQNNQEEYGLTSAKIIAFGIHKHNERVTKNKCITCSQTYNLKQGIKEFGKEGEQAVTKEMKQLLDRSVFSPIHPHKMSDSEQKKAMESLIFLTQKKDGTIKAKACANGSTQRQYIPKEEASSPTTSMESILITGTIDAKQGQDILTADIPNAFVQTPLSSNDKEKIIMKIRGELVNIIVNMDEVNYKQFVSYEQKQPILYVSLNKALYGMLTSALLFHKKLRKDLESIGFIMNPYDPCVANRKIKGSQQTLVWHVDDIKSSHMDPRVNDEFLLWLKRQYGNEGLGEVKYTRGMYHEYLGMTLDYSEQGKLRIDMREYIKKTCNFYPEKLSETTNHPWGDKLFQVKENEVKLDDNQNSLFHTTVMKLMFLAKQGRPDILPGVCFLSTRIKNSTKQDLEKLKRIMNFLNSTINNVLTLEADDSQSVSWFVDASFAPHADYKSHTGACFTIGKGMISSFSNKQKNNSRSSTEAELNAVDDKISKVLWTKRFIESQGFILQHNFIKQDNQSAIKSENNDSESTGKRTRHFNIKLFYVTDLIENKEVEIEYCNTDNMVADYFSKPLIGKKFNEFRKIIMNL